jgi:molecular chaperone DnaK (HSP70)
MKPNATGLDGREMPLMTVIAESLKYISNKAIAKLEEQIGKVMNLKKIRWVLTVPALWGEDHKLFMKKAAVQAGIIDHSSSTQLLLCLEPEGASIQCREDAEETLKSEMLKNDIVMVLDCGGGTVDITVHKLTCDITEKFCCEEILPTSGGCEWGSKYVDKYFEEFLKDFFKEELYALYLKNGIARLEILKHFEMLKR